MEQERKPDRPEDHFAHAVGGVINGDVAGQTMAEFSTEAGVAEELHHAPAFFGSQHAGDTMGAIGGSPALKAFGTVATPLALDASIHNLSSKDPTERALAVANTASSGIGTAGELADLSTNHLIRALAGSNSVLGAAGAVIGSGAAGYSIGTEFNAITRESGQFGRNLDGKGADGKGSNRSFSDEVGDDAFDADQATTEAIRGSRVGSHLPDWVARGVGHAAGIGTGIGESVDGAVMAAPVVLGHELGELKDAAVEEADSIGDRAADAAVSADEATQGWFQDHHLGAVAGLAGGIAGAGTVLGESALGTMAAVGGVEVAAGKAVAKTAKDAWGAAKGLWGEGKTLASEGLHWLGL